MRKSSSSKVDKIKYWWHNIDRANLIALILLSSIGVILVFAASPAVAVRSGYDEYHFVKKQIFFLTMGLPLFMVGLSFLSVRGVKMLVFLGFSLSLIAMIMVPLIGVGHKGATRWINIGPLSIQPSEFMKSYFTLFNAWLFAMHYKKPCWKYIISVFFLAVIVMLLIQQPDIGMTLTLLVIWGVQLFLSGAHLYIISMLAVGAVSGVVILYNLFSHVQKRMDAFFASFLDPASTESYQVRKSLEAYHSGGMTGKGIGEGVAKQYIPDSHTDFIFAVAGEEFGLLGGLFVLVIFAFIIFRGFYRIWHEENNFIVIAVTGILTQFMTQIFVNIGVSLNLLPAKGMTLPFISYGGSSILAFSMSMGFMLALTKKRYGIVAWSRKRVM
jgi:cell division protein FtsW